MTDPSGVGIAMRIAIGGRAGTAVLQVGKAQESW